MFQHTISKREAIKMAEETAEISSLPQTVYFDKESGDWMFNCYGSKALHIGSKRAVVTILPRCYFN